MQSSVCRQNTYSRTRIYTQHHTRCCVYTQHHTPCCVYTHQYIPNRTYIHIQSYTQLYTHIYAQLYTNNHIHTGALAVHILSITYTSVSVYKHSRPQNSRTYTTIDTHSSTQNHPHISIHRVARAYNLSSTHIDIHTHSRSPTATDPQSYTHNRTTTAVLIQPPRTHNRTHIVVDTENTHTTVQTQPYTCPCTHGCRKQQCTQHNTYIHNNLHTHIRTHKHNGTHKHTYTTVRPQQYTHREAIPHPYKHSHTYIYVLLHRQTCVHILQQ